MDVEEDFQRMWKIASTAQFVKAFQELFKLPEIEIENLEEGLLSKSMYGIHVLKTLIVALLKGICPNSGVRLDNFGTILQRIVAKIWISEGRQDENPLKEGTQFEALAPLSKLDTVYLLCLNLLDKTSDPRSKWRDQVSKMNGDLLRVQPLGCDDEGNEYWYFYGTRLYKQEPGKDKKIKDWEEEWNTQKNTSFVKRGRGRPRKMKLRKSDGESDESEEVLTKRDRYMNLGEKSRWSVVCNTLDDWVEFAEKFKESKSKCERALFRTLTDSFLPVMNDAYQAKEKKLQQKLRELIPKPTFTRMETRQRRTNSENGIDSKQQSTRDRENRLEERKRRLSQNVNGSRRRSRSRISYDENYDDLDEEPIEKDKNQLFVESDLQDYFETTRRKSKVRESMEAQANEIVKEYASLVSNNNGNKSQVLQVFTQVKLDKNSYPFHYAVDKKEFPDYYDFISEPMDLSRIERKLRLNIYKTAAEIDDDFKMMVENCELYFGVDSERSKMAKHTWRLFRRLMKELPVKAKKNEPVSNQTGQKESSKFTEKKKIDFNSERTGRIRKRINNEALEILSMEAELAVERSQSMDEEHFRNFTNNANKNTRFSDLKVESIHSHPSELIQKFTSDSSNDGNEESNCVEFSSIDGHNCSLNTSPKKVGMNYHLESEEDFMNKNPKSFSILSSDCETNLLSDNEVDTNCVSNILEADISDGHLKDGNSCGNDSNALDIPSNNSFTSNLIVESAELNTSPSNSSFDSYNSSTSCSPEIVSKDSSIYNPQHILDDYEYASYAPENESSRSTVDASCLGLASASTYKEQQFQNESKTSVTENISQSPVLYNNENQNSYNNFGKLNSENHGSCRNHSKSNASNSNDELMRERFSPREISRNETDSTMHALQAINVPMENQELSKNIHANSSFPSHQFIQGQTLDQELSTKHSPEQEIHHKSKNLDHLPRQPRGSPSFSLHEKVQENTESQQNQSSVFCERQEINELELSRIHERNSPTVTESFDSVKNKRSPSSPFSQEILTQVSSNHQTSPSAYGMHQEVKTLLVIPEHSKNDQKHSVTSTNNEMLSQEMAKASYQACSFPPAVSNAHDYPEGHLRPVKDHQKKSNIAYQNKLDESVQMRFDSQVENGEINRGQPMASANQLFNKNQSSLKKHPLYLGECFEGGQPRYSPVEFANQEVNHQQPTKTNLDCSSTQAVHQQTYQPVQSQSKCLSAAFTAQVTKKSTKTLENSFSTNNIDEEDSAIIQSNHSPTFSNQGISAQEPAKSSPQHMNNISPSTQSKVPTEAPAFDFGNIFSSTLNSMNPSPQVTEPQLSVNSAVQIPSQVPVSHSNQSYMSRYNFPTMKVRLPPSTGELIVVPGDPSSMTFHLLAKPLSDPSQTIQSSVEIHAQKQDNSNDKPASTRNKISVKHDAHTHRKQSSPINDLQHLASNPRRSPNSSTFVKNGLHSRSLESGRSTDSLVIKPNAVLVRPLESMKSHCYQEESFAQSVEGSRTLPTIYPKGNRMTNVLGTSGIPTSSVSAMSLNVNNQRPVIPNDLPNGLMQNCNGQYMFVPSKDLFQSNTDQNMKMKNPEKPPPFYPNNIVQSFPFQNGHMNPVQMLPQVHLPYVNPYYIVTNPSTFQNASRYPVMNMQPIPFQNR